MEVNAKHTKASFEVLSKKKLAIATFAGGCFWCMEGPFEAEKGVAGVFAGYTGGTEKNPAYHDVASGSTGHVEAVRVFYDPKKVSYETLLSIFWRNIDPTDPGGQFADRGDSYKTGIYYHSDDQKKLAEASKKQLASSGKFDKPIVTKIIRAGAFYLAEDYHQDYYKKYPTRYRFYKIGSGREAFLKKYA